MCEPVSSQYCNITQFVLNTYKVNKKYLKQIIVVNSGTFLSLFSRGLWIFPKCICLSFMEFLRLFNVHLSNYSVKSAFLLFRRITWLELGDNLCQMYDEH